MNRHFAHLNQLQQGFINIVYIQCRTFGEAAAELNVDKQIIRDLNKDLDSTWRQITPIRDKWKKKNIEVDFWDFYNWVQIAEKCCHYCGITQVEIDKLHKLGINNKRTTRGRSLEIDRKIPDEAYSNIDNLVYSCYWCNNAKTDTFTEAEFKIIGQAIKKVWNKRLGHDH